MKGLVNKSVSGTCVWAVLFCATATLAAGRTDSGTERDWLIDPSVAGEPVTR